MRTKHIQILTILLFLFLLYPGISFSQDTTNDQIEMADALLANGKIYIVVTVLSVIFIGIVIYLIKLDRKISSLEKKSRSN